MYDNGELAKDKFTKMEWLYTEFENIKKRFQNKYGKLTFVTHIPKSKKENYIDVLAKAKTADEFDLNKCPKEWKIPKKD